MQVIKGLKSILKNKPGQFINDELTTHYLATDSHALVAVPKSIIEQGQIDKSLLASTYNLKDNYTASALKYLQNTAIAKEVVHIAITEIKQALQDHKQLLQATTSEHKTVHFNTMILNNFINALGLKDTDCLALRRPIIAYQKYLPWHYKNNIDTLGEPLGMEENDFYGIITNVIVN